MQQNGATNGARQMQAGETPRDEEPDWADGLRQLYDSVVDEPLPDAFKDLLDKLDEEGDEPGECEADGSDRSPE